MDKWIKGLKNNLNKFILIKLEGEGRNEEREILIKAGDIVDKYGED